MFRTTKCLSLGSLDKQLYGILSRIYISSLVTVRVCLTYQTQPVHMYITMHSSENIKFVFYYVHLKVDLLIVRIYTVQHKDKHKPVLK
jgi:hypothetical protein